MEQSKIILEAMRYAQETYEIHVVNRGYDYVEKQISTETMNKLKKDFENLLTRLQLTDDTDVFCITNRLFYEILVNSGEKILYDFALEYIDLCTVEEILPTFIIHSRISRQWLPLSLVELKCLQANMALIITDWHMKTGGLFRSDLGDFGFDKMEDTELDIKLREKILPRIIQNEREITARFEKDMKEPVPEYAFVKDKKEFRDYFEYLTNEINCDVTTIANFNSSSDILVSDHYSSLQEATDISYYDVLNKAFAKKYNYPYK